jgi:hypothetical protein
MLFICYFKIVLLNCPECNKLKNIILIYLKFDNDLKWLLSNAILVLSTSTITKHNMSTTNILNRYLCLDIIKTRSDTDLINSILVVL